MNIYGLRIGAPINSSTINIGDCSVEAYETSIRSKSKCVMACGNSVPVSNDSPPVFFGGLDSSGVPSFLGDKKEIRAYAAPDLIAARVEEDEIGDVLNKPGYWILGKASPAL